MSDLLSRIKARLESQRVGQSAEEPGWVRKRLASLPEEAERPSSADGLQGDQAEEEEEEAVAASQRLWESGVFDRALPDGFYIPYPGETARSVLGRVQTLPPLRDLQEQGPRSMGVLVVDSRRDKTLARLRRLAAQLLQPAPGEEPPPEATKIRKIADMVVDFFLAGTYDDPKVLGLGGARRLGNGGRDRDRDASGSDSAPELGTMADGAGCPTVYLGDLRAANCQPRALLFKVLCDHLQVPSRLLAGLQLPSAAGGCTSPSEHLSSVVMQVGVELLVDLMRRPAGIKPLSCRSLCAYHLPGAADSDSAESWDSSAEPNSPLLDSPEQEAFGFAGGKAGRRSPAGGMASSAASSQSGGASPTQSQHAQHAQPQPPSYHQGTHPVASMGPTPPAPLMPTPPSLGIGGSLSPTSEPEPNPFRRRSRRRALKEERMQGSAVALGSMAQGGGGGFLPVPPGPGQGMPPRPVGSSEDLLELSQQYAAPPRGHLGHRRNSMEGLEEEEQEQLQQGVQPQQQNQHQMHMQQQQMHLQQQQHQQQHYQQRMLAQQQQLYSRQDMEVARLAGEYSDGGQRYYRPSLMGYPRPPLGEDPYSARQAAYRRGLISEDSDAAVSSPESTGVDAAYLLRRRTITGGPGSSVLAPDSQRTTRMLPPHRRLSGEGIPAQHRMGRSGDESSGPKRTRRRNVMPQPVSDEVVEAVRAMNNAFRKERGKQQQAVDQHQQQLQPQQEQQQQHIAQLQQQQPGSEGDEAELVSMASMGSSRNLDGSDSALGAAAAAATAALSSLALGTNTGGSMGAGPSMRSPTTAGPAAGHFPSAAAAAAAAAAAMLGVGSSGSSASSSRSNTLSLSRLRPEPDSAEQQNLPAGGPQQALARDSAGPGNALGQGPVPGPKPSIPQFEMLREVDALGSPNDLSSGRSSGTSSPNMGPSFRTSLSGVQQQPSILSRGPYPPTDPRAPSSRMVSPASDQGVEARQLPQRPPEAQAVGPSEGHGKDPQQPPPAGVPAVPHGQICPCCYRPLPSAYTAHIPQELSQLLHSLSSRLQEKGGEQAEQPLEVAGSRLIEPQANPAESRGMPVPPGSGAEGAAPSNSISASTLLAPAQGAGSGRPTAGPFGRVEASSVVAPLPEGSPASGGSGGTAELMLDLSKSRLGHTQAQLLAEGGGSFSADVHQSGSPGALPPRGTRWPSSSSLTSMLAGVPSSLSLGGGPPGGRGAGPGGPGESDIIYSQALLDQVLPFAPWSVDFNEITIGSRVGVGSFGEVFRGIWRGTEVAVKVLLEQELNRENTEDFFNEISILSRLRHPNVILFMGACTVPPHLSMVSEYMHMGSLYGILHNSAAVGGQPPPSWRRRLKMLRDICRGMMCLQRMGIVHRDLKSANCLVDKHWTVKVCDFGLSKMALNGTVDGKSGIGTPEWTAPELLRGEEVCTAKCDVFSLGVIMWEVCTLQRPWEGYKPVQVVHAVAYEKLRLPVPDNLLGQLIADCWNDDPSLRPDYSDILSTLHECEFLQT